ncbi:CPSF A subunit region-domain-containing protein [Dimargaris cristalligena]|uniref:CPSF A subunit region-domain-containing protein n=1 Tax=Dimargaris cristalligena TaxID=215637 RepID=A0A4Q0A170_9FUNG|nr:CPSF A subunit region-domain-containing protein [Dimargaris cristalligena]|eukprot:RKP39032.1 CPSF A subunit region-domain-containing protein [Dimargaris cristalligena]
MSLYPVYQELIPPTATYHCAAGHFTGRNDTNLILVRGNVLEVYLVIMREMDPSTSEANRVHPTSTFAYTYQTQAFDLDADQALDFSNPDKDSSEIRTLQAFSQTGTPRLQLVLKAPLQGQVQSLTLVQTSASEAHGRSYLLLALAEAKMALLEYSPTGHCFVTVSIHYYEWEEFRTESLQEPWPPTVITDPNGRCAILQVYRDRIAVLPFRQAENADLALGPTSMAADLNRKRPLPMTGSVPPATSWPYSPSFMLDLEQLDQRVAQVLDIVFLHGYYVPTLAILYEAPETTWTGNLKNQRDTCSVIVLSLDLMQKGASVIYHKTGLPYDCFKIVPVPIPTGGLMVVAANALIHLSQGSAGVGVAVNSMEAMSCYTAFPLNRVHIDQPGSTADDSTSDPIQLRLECSQSVFLDHETMLMSLASGQLLLVRCLSHGRSVSNLKLALIGESVTPSCVSLVSPDLLFLGSAMGDSQLIRFQIPPVGSATRVVYDIEPVRPRTTSLLPPTSLSDSATESAGDSKPVSGMATNPSAGESLPPVEDEDDWDEELYGPMPAGKSTAAPFAAGQSATGPSARSTSNQPKWFSYYRFNVSDSVLCLAPMSCATLGLTPADVGNASATDSDTAEPSNGPARFVAGSGYGAASSLSILQRHIQPDVLTSFHLPGFKYIWSLQMQDQQSGSSWGLPNSYEPDSDTAFTKYLVLSKPGATLVLESSDELQQVEDTGFAETALTVGVAEWANHRQIVQVTEDAVYLLNHQVQRIQSLTIDEYTNSTTIRIVDCHIVDPFVLLVLTDGSVALVTRVNSAQPQLHFVRIPTHLNRSAIVSACLFDDIYGCFKPLSSVLDVDLTLADPLAPDDSPSDATSTTNVAVEATATLEIDLPPPRPVASMDIDDDEQVDFDDADALGDGPPSASLRSGGSTRHHVDEDNVSNLQQALSAANTAPQWCCVFRLNGALEIYALPKYQLVLYPQVHPLRLPPSYLAEVETEVEGDDLTAAKTAPKPTLPTSASGLTGFCEFHSSQVDRGFIALDDQSRLHIGQLDRDVIYDFDWPLRRIGLGRTIHYLAYHPTVGAFCVVTSTPQPFTLPSKDEEEEAKLEQAIHAANQKMNIELPPSPPRSGRPVSPEPNPTDQGKMDLKPLVPHFQIDLISPEAWEIIDTYVLEPDHHVTDFKCLSLTSRQTVTGRKFYMAASTSLVNGEDRAMRGHALLFDIIEVVPEPGRPLTKYKLKLVCEDEVGGPVSALCAVNGHLIVPTGPRVFAKNFRDGIKLEGVAFVDLLLYVTSATVLKNFILMGDTSKGAALVGFQDEPANLVMLGRDYLPMDVTCGEFIVDDRSTYFLVADDRCNIFCLSYSPRHVQSFSGQKLLRRADFHLGCRVTCMMRLPSQSALRLRPDHHPAHNLSNNARHHSNRPPPGPQHPVTQKQLCLCGTDSGAVFAVSSVPEKTFKRLQRLYLYLTNGIPHVAGLNPRAFRLLPVGQRLTSNPAKNFVDLSLINQYLDPLPISKQREFTHRIGSTLDRVAVDVTIIPQEIGYF